MTAQEIRIRTQELINENKLTQEDLSLSLQRNRSNISRFLRNKTTLNKEALTKLESLLKDYDTDWVIIKTNSGRLVDFLINKRKKDQKWIISYRKNKVLLDFPIRLEKLFYWKNDSVSIPQEAVKILSDRIK